MSMEKVAERLRELEKDNGRLIPADVVDAARDPESPLHQHFEWDDSEAAEKYRLHQARGLIRSVKFEVRVQTFDLTTVRYVRDPDAPAQTAGYRSVVHLRSEEDTARAVLVEEMQRVSAAVRRAKALAIVLGVNGQLEEIDRLAQEITANVSQHPSAQA